MDPVGIDPAYLLDSALSPLRSLASPAGAAPVRFFVFYQHEGRFWGSDGASHIPINPVLMGYFVDVCLACDRPSTRGELFSTLGGAENDRHGIVVDNTKLHAALVLISDALAFAKQANFPS